MSAPLDASKLEITKTTKPSEPYQRRIGFGKSFTDHILEVEWTAEKGWGVPTIKPYHNFSLIQPPVFYIILLSYLKV